MEIGVPKETIAGERRVGLVPEGVEKLRGRDLGVRVQAGAGREYYADEAYADAGAEVVSGSEELLGRSQLVAKVLPPTDEEIELLPRGGAVVSFLQPVPNAEVVRKLAERGLTAVSMDAIPRIARAQSMDALSSMSSIGGYKSVLLGANALGRHLPMMTTAAGTIKAGRVLVLGAGVAGLQAIATAHRLGAEVTAFDIRPEVKEQVESLGATFLEEEPDRGEPAATETGAPEEDEPRTGVAAAVAWIKDVFEIGQGTADGELPDDDGSPAPDGDEEEQETGTGGYAREQAEDKQRRDRDLIRERLREVDLVITTALVPGKRAPVLVTRDMVEAMPPGSVVMDLAAEAGGNCELTRPGEVVDHEQVSIHGPQNLPSLVPIDASRLYSSNVVSLLSHLTSEGELNLDFDDEIADAVCLAHGGEVRSDAVREAIGEGGGSDPAAERDRRGTDADAGGEGGG